MPLIVAEPKELRDEIVGKSVATITSKRILMVGEGTSNGPHEKVLDVEIDHDQNLITLIKDGRQKPLYIRVTDTIYSGILMNQLSLTAS